MLNPKSENAFPTKTESFQCNDGTWGHWAKICLENEGNTFRRNEAIVFPFSYDKLRYHLEVVPSFEVCFSNDHLEVHLGIECLDDRLIGYKISILDRDEVLVSDQDEPNKVFTIFKEIKLQENKKYSKKYSFPMDKHLLSHDMLIILFELNNMHAKMDCIPKTSCRPNKHKPTVVRDMLNLSGANLNNVIINQNTIVTAGNINQQQQQHSWIQEIQEQFISYNRKFLSHMDPIKSKLKSYPSIVSPETLVIIHFMMSVAPFISLIM